MLGAEEDEPEAAMPYGVNEEGLEIARRLSETVGRLPLATLDRKLAEAARAEGVPVAGPLGEGPD